MRLLERIKTIAYVEEVWRLFDSAAGWYESARKPRNHTNQRIGKMIRAGAR